MLWFWIFVGPAILLAILSLRGERRRAEYMAARLAELGEPAQELPLVTLIVAAAGPAEGLAETLRALAEQDYPDYELILAAPGAECIPAGKLPSSMKVALAGETDRTQLVRAAIRAARHRSQVFAFAEVGGLVSSSWLRAMVSPLSEPGVGTSAGFRWYTPEPPAFWPLLRSVWSGVMAGRFGPGASDFAWDGAVAMSKATFFDSRLHERFDTFAITEGMREAGQRIAFAPGGMVAIPGAVTMPAFLSQASAEMAQARRFLPLLWWKGLAAHILYCGAMAASVAAILRGNRGAEWALVALFGLGMLKGVNRATLAKAELPHCSGWFDRYGWVHTFWVPLATWVWLGVLLASVFEQGKAGHCDTMTEEQEPTHHAN